MELERRKQTSSSGTAVETSALFQSLAVYKLFKLKFSESIICNITASKSAELHRPEELQSTTDC